MYSTITWLSSGLSIKIRLNQNLLLSLLSRDFLVTVRMPWGTLSSFLWAVLPFVPTAFIFFGDFTSLRALRWSSGLICFMFVVNNFLNAYTQRWFIRGVYSVSRMGNVPRAPRRLMPIVLRSLHPYRIPYDHPLSASWDSLIPPSCGLWRHFLLGWFTSVLFHFHSDMLDHWCAVSVEPSASLRTGFSASVHLFIVRASVLFVTFFMSSVPTVIDRFLRKRTTNQTRSIDWRRSLCRSKI